MVVESGIHEEKNLWVCIQPKGWYLGKKFLGKVNVINSSVSLLYQKEQRGFFLVIKDGKSDLQEKKKFHLSYKNFGLMNFIVMSM